MVRPDQRKRSQERFAKLEARVIHVPETTIRKKWRRLPTANHSAIRELVSSAEEQSRHRKGRSGIDLASEASVRDVVNKLTQKLIRMPYPVGTEEQYFDHEANLHRVNRVEEQLSSNTHAINLLRAQLAKEEQFLKQDEAEAKYLEESLKSNEVMRRQQSRTLHSVAQEILTHTSNAGSADLAENVDKESTSYLQLLFDDQDMVPTLEQLQNHLESMHNNGRDVRDVKCVVEETGVALRTSTSLR